MQEPQEGDFDVLGSLDFANEAVQLEGECGEWATYHHEAKQAQKLHSIVSAIGGKVIGDEAFYI